MRRKLLLSLISMWCFTVAVAQRYVEVANQTITVNSQSTLTGNSRNYVKVDFPEKTSGFIYRITISSKGTNSDVNNLFQLLNQAAPGDIAIGISLTRFAINSNDGTAVDAFVFSNIYDANNFVNKNDGNWFACQQSNNVVNTCYSSNKCLNPSMYFGFRNNNLVNGLNVHLDVVAIVDSTRKSDYAYSYLITNNTKYEVKYLVSDDGLNWEGVTLRTGYSYTLTRDVPSLHFRMFTSPTNFVNYNLQPNERYKIIWSTDNRWDLLKF